MPLTIAQSSNGVIGLVRSAAHALLGPFTEPVRHVRALVEASPGLSLLVLVVLVVAAVRAIRGDRLAALALVPLSLAWVVVDAPFEGPTLLVLSWSHGITAADLISVAGLGIATWRLGGRVLAPLR
jgi:hypothetical protein